MSIEVKISKKPITYKKAMLFMNKRVEEVKLGKNNELIWLLEHPTTYSAGVSFNKKDILNKNIKVIKTNRGGKITLHNKGQKIIYFVINLNKRKKDIRKFISIIEKTIKPLELVTMKPEQLCPEGLYAKQIDEAGASLLKLPNG